MKRTHYINEITDEMNSQEVILGGWVQDIRNIGSIAFIQLRDRNGIVQLTLIKKELGEEKFKNYINLSRESVVLVKGKVQKTNQTKIGFEILPTEIEILNMAKTPLPLGVIDKVSANIETRLENRYLDLRKPEVSAIFKIKESIVNGFRKTLINEKFIEIHTPKIVATATEGGTNLFTVKYFEKDAFLNQSPQLYKQIMMSAGFDKVFEIGPAFRAEEHNTTRHLNEFISMDIELSFVDEEGAMQILEKVIYGIVKEVVEKNQKEMELLNISWETPSLPLKRITYDEALKEIESSGMKMEYGEDFSMEALRVLGKNHQEFYFITEWPIAIKPFYVMPFENKPEFGRAFDLQYGEKEITSGAQRIHLPKLLKQKMMEKGLTPDNFQFYLNAFEYGMPPHAGWGLGLERMTMILTKVENIRETTIFPRDRTRLTP